MMELQSYHANQNHKIWLISRLLARNPIWCKCSLDSNLRSYATGDWLWPISEDSSWSRILAFLHNDGSSTSAVTVILRELCGLLTIWNTHSLKDRSFAHRQLGTNGAKTCCLTHSFVVQPYNSDYHNGYHQKMLYDKIRIHALPPLGCASEQSENGKMWVYFSNRSTFYVRSVSYFPPFM